MTVQRKSLMFFETKVNKNGAKGALLLSTRYKSRKLRHNLIFLSVNF